jgi:hypothetical protein
MKKGENMISRPVQKSSFINLNYKNKMYVFVYVFGFCTWRSLFAMLSLLLNIYFIAIVNTFALINQMNCH